MHTSTDPREPGSGARYHGRVTYEERTARFKARIEPIKGDARGSRLILAYTGGLSGRVFHGAVIVKKKSEDGALIVIQYHGFHKGT